MGETSRKPRRSTTRHRALKQARRATLEGEGKARTLAGGIVTRRRTTGRTGTRRRRQRKTSMPVSTLCVSEEAAGGPET